MIFYALVSSLNQDSGFPCFKGGPRAIQNLRKRFHLSLTEEVCQNFMNFNLFLLYFVLYYNVEYSGVDVLKFFSLAAMCIIGALSHQQQLRCLADTPI